MRPSIEILPQGAHQESAVRSASVSSGWVPFIRATNAASTTTSPATRSAIAAPEASPTFGPATLVMVLTPPPGSSGKRDVVPRIPLINADAAALAAAGEGCALVIDCAVIF